jgi:NDP-sugar pyrophosphorylase family protein
MIQLAIDAALEAGQFLKESIGQVLQVERKFGQETNLVTQIDRKAEEIIIKKIKQRKIEIKGAVLIGRHCQIDDDVRIVNSCIDNFTRIAKGAAIENSAVMDRVIIGEKAEVVDSIIGRHVTVQSTPQQRTKICGVSVIADDVIVEEGCNISATKIYPHQEVRGEFQNQVLMPNQPKP